MTALLAEPRLRQHQPPERARDLRRASRSPTTTATERSTSTRSTSTSATWPSCRELVDGGARAGDQGHPGPGREPHAAPTTRGSRTRRRPPGSTAPRPAPGQHLADLDAHRPARDAGRRSGRRSTGWFIDILPDLNQNDPEAARYIIQNTLWWVGVSGLDGDPPGHAALRAARVSGATGWRRSSASTRGSTSSARCSTATRRSSPSSRAARRASTASTRASTRCSTSRSSSRSARAFAQGKPLRELAMMLGPRSSLPRTPRCSSPSSGCTTWRAS